VPAGEGKQSCVAAAMALPAGDTAAGLGAGDTALHVSARVQPEGKGWGRV